MAALHDLDLATAAAGTSSWWLGADALPASSLAALAATQTEAPPRLTKLPPCPRPRNARGARGEAWPARPGMTARAPEPAESACGPRSDRPARPRPLVLRLAWAGGVVCASLYLGGLAELLARAIS